MSQQESIYRAVNQNWSAQREKPTHKPAEAFKAFSLSVFAGAPISLKTKMCNVRGKLDAHEFDYSIAHSNSHLRVEESAGGDASQGYGPVDVSRMSLTELTGHIETTHHAHLKRELPRLQRLVEKIASRHGDNNPKLRRLAVAFSALRFEVESRIAKEKTEVFPFICMLDNARNGEFSPSVILDYIRVMGIEHLHAGDSLCLIRSLTDDFVAPPDSCNTYRATMRGLHQLDVDMHQQVRKENQLLFPKAARRAGAAANLPYSDAI